MERPANSRSRWMRNPSSPAHREDTSSPGRAPTRSPAWPGRAAAASTASRSPPMAGCAMCKLLLLAVGIMTAIFAQSAKYGVGRAPTPEEVKAWDISVAPDGTGLPEGSGTAAQGKDVYASKCAKCHGGQGQGGDEGPLAGGQGSLRGPKPLKTVGSYWPYATTLFD